MSTFEFYVAGIEDGILAVLETPLKEIGVRAFETYSGELDSANLKEALGALSPKFPLVLASYTDGADTPDPKMAPVANRSLHFRHDCSFAVICITNDARGERARRRGKPVKHRTTGCYQMISEVRDLIGGLRLQKTVDNTDLELYGEPLYLGEVRTLTVMPLMPVAVEHIARMPNMTAYAAIFETAFRWQTKDRQGPALNVSEIEIGVEALNEAGTGGENLPGVSQE